MSKREKGNKGESRKYIIYFEVSLGKKRIY